MAHRSQNMYEEQQKITISHLWLYVQLVRLNTA